MTYCVVDLETETHASFRRKANPFDIRNRIIASGYRNEGACVVTKHDKEGLDVDYALPISTSLRTLVGFNIKFDLLYLWKSTSLQEYLKSGGKIWDCQLAEFMLGAQTEEYPSLDAVATRYGGTLKDDRIKMLWESGLQTSEIDSGMLLEYLKNDVLNTEKVYLGQLERLKDQPKLKRLIELQMDALLATTEMEYNGMYIDKEELVRVGNKLDEAISELDFKIDMEIKELVPKDLFEHFNLNSNKHLTALLFGGTVDLQESRPQLDSQGLQLLYKTGSRAGQVKYKMQTVTHTLKPLCRPVIMTPKGEPAVNHTALELLAKKPATDAGKIASLLVERRVLVKKQNTYFTAIKDLIQEDGLLHGSLNHCSVITGRLSSTAPNLQNMPKEDDEDPFNVKSAFVSRWGDLGAIVNIDWKSLEFMVAQILCNDPQMTADILNGVDIHRETASVVFRVPKEQVTDKQRTMAKRASFALLYGGSAKGSVGDIFHKDELKAQNFIDTFYNKYKKLKQWHTTMFDLAKSKLKSTGVLYKGFYVKKAVLPNISGRLLAYEEATGYKETALEMPKLFSSITKNYPVQSLGADIVLSMLGILFRKLIKHRDQCLLINTVHDSIVIDCKKEFLQSLIKGAKLILESSPKMLDRELGIDCSIPLPVDITYGKSWGSK